VRNALYLVVLAISATCTLAADNWPQFRGPTSDGQTDAAVPTTWGEKSNVTWKTAIHDRGWSSPVIWGDQVWMTTATTDGKAMSAVCVNKTTGKIVHDVQVFRVRSPQKINSLNSYASPTPAIEAGRVYVHFGTYGTACLDTKTGKILWSRRDVNCDHSMGPGSSPVLWGKLLILTLDGMDVQYMTALDTATGSTVWKTPRSTDFAGVDGDNRKAYSTATIFDIDGRSVMVTNGAGAAIAYDPKTGKELWLCNYKRGYSNVCRPIMAAGNILINSGFGKARLMAVRPGGKGDVTKTHVAWQNDKNMPIKPSLAVVDSLIFMADDKGVLSCLDAKSGKLVWTERLGGKFSSSPIVSGKRIYFFDDRGRSTVIEAARTYKKLVTNTLEEGCMASPAVSGKTLFLRTKTHLYRIEE